MKSIMVIARNDEEINPINEDHFIVQKNEHLPNIGREASSYLWWIIKNYDNLPDLVKFRQAKMEEHAVGKYNFVCDWSGHPHHPSLHIERFSNLIDLKIPKSLYFTSGAQFDISKENIVSNTKEWYENCFELSMTDKQAPWIMERLWKYIFYETKCVVKMMM